MVSAPPSRARAAQPEPAMPSPLSWYEAPIQERSAQLRRGAPADWLRNLEDAMAIRRQELCGLVGLKLSTVNRKLHHHSVLSQDETERLMGLVRLIGQVQALVRDCGREQGFEAATWVAQWLQRPNQALGGLPPAQLMDTAEGRDLVALLIGSMRSGSYM